MNFMRYCAGILLCVNVFSAGAQWQWSNPRPQGNDLWNVRFAPGSTTCWAVGAAGSIIKSADGGASWSWLESGTSEFLLGVAAPTTGLTRGGVEPDRRVIETAIDEPVEPDRARRLGHAHGRLQGWAMVDTC